MSLKRHGGARKVAFTMRREGRRLELVGVLGLLCLKDTGLRRLFRGFLRLLKAVAMRKNPTELPLCWHSRLLD